MKKTVCIPAMMLALLMVVVLLVSAYYIAIEADHDCSGDNCPICAWLTVCENILSWFLSVHIVMIAAALAGLHICLKRETHIRTGAFSTLITLKIKLSD